MNPAKVILFNGPPRSGKDTAVNCILSTYGNAEGIKFAEPLHAAARATLTQMDSSYYGAIAKDEVIPSVGVSYRQLCINLSENHFKKAYGEDVFGRIALHKMQSTSKIYRSAVITYCISDSGFATEIKPIIEYYGAKAVTLVQIEREGCDFGKDSRSYIDLSSFGIKPIKLVNADRTEFEKAVKAVYVDSQAVR